MQSSGVTTEFPIDSDMNFYFIWDWQNKEASFQDLPFVDMKIDGIERIKIGRQGDDWFMIDRLWYRVYFYFGNFYFTGVEKDDLIIIAGKCYEHSVFID